MPADAEALGTVGPAAYAAAYDELWDDPAAYAALLDSYGAAAFRLLLADGDTATWIAQVGGRVVGFLTLHPHSPLDGEAGGAEVRRLYLLGPARGAGLGRRLFEAARDHAAGIGTRYLWLDAMVSAAWAWGAYERWGFRRVGGKLVDRPVRPDRRAMHVLRLDLP